MTNGDQGRPQDPLEVLLERVERDREERCRKILESARSDADRVRGEAFAQARSRLHRTVRDERRRVEDELRAARAEQETRHRHQRHRRINAALERAWSQLERALEARWQDPRGRRAWMQGALEQAARFLPPGTWTLHHPPAVGANELPDLTGIADAERIALETAPDSELTTGVRIGCGGTRLDATPEGLLADRERVRSWLLAAIERHRRGDDAS